MKTLHADMVKRVLLLLLGNIAFVRCLLGQEVTLSDYIYNYRDSVEYKLDNRAYVFVNYQRLNQ